MACHNLNRGVNKEDSMLKAGIVLILIRSSKVFVRSRFSRLDFEVENR